VAETNEIDEVEIAFNLYEKVYTKLNNGLIRENNKYPASDPERVEYDLTEREKEWLALLRAKLHMEIASKVNDTLRESSSSSDRLGMKVFWLNIVVAIFTLVMAISAVVELTQ